MKIKKLVRIISKSRYGSLPFSVAIATMMSVAIVPPLSAADADAANAACDAADTARKAAAEVGMEWRDIKKSVKKARKMLEDGDFGKATTMCEQATFQGEAGIAQAEMEKKNWMARVPK